MNKSLQSINNIQLKYKKLSQHVKGLETLTQIGIAFSSELETKKLLQLIADVSRKVTKATATAILMVEQKNKKNSYKFAGLSGASKSKVKILPKGVGVYKYIAEYKKALCISDLQQDPRSSGVPKGHIKVRSFLGVPLLSHNNKIIGMLLLIHSKPNMFSKYEVELATILANQGVVAIENARLNSELNQSLENLKEANKKLETLDKMKSDFLANISHEFRTPLTSIKGYSQLLIDKKFGVITKEQEDKIQVILRNTDRIILLINNLLDTIKFENAEIQLNLKTFNLENLIKHCITEITPLLYNKRLESVLINKLPNNIEIKGDEQKIHLVLINFLGNAIKFTEKGNITIRIEKINGKDFKFINSPNKNKCVIEKKQKYIKISIIDTGIGMSPETIKKLFNRFYQADSGTTRKYGGTGLGLSIVKEILDLHSSPIEVKSIEGKGSTFSFLLSEAK